MSIAVARTDESPRAKLLAFRRRVVEAAAAKRAAPRVRQPQHPNAIAIEMQRWLIGISHSIDRVILRALADEQIVRLDQELPMVPDMTRAEVDRLLRAVQRRIAKFTSRNALIAKLDALAGRTQRFSREQWQAQLKGALGIDLTADPDLADMIDRFREQNVRRIKTLADEKIDRVRDVLHDAGSGARVETVQNRITQQLGVTESHAALIARTEISSLAAKMTRARHQAAGIQEFIVSTARDERVRPSHAALDGRRFSYDNLPLVDGERWLPGAIYNCRCVCIPVLPGLDDE